MVYDVQHQYGVVYVKTAKIDVRTPIAVDVDIAADTLLANTADYPAAPATGDLVAADSLIVLNRPAEEPGHPLENALMASRELVPHAA